MLLLSCRCLKWTVRWIRVSDVNHSGVFSWLVTSSEAAGDAGLVPNGTLNPRGLALSPHFCEVMLLWLWSADRGHITATKWTLLNAKMRNGTPYGLVDLTDTHACKTASAHEVFHLGQGRRLDEMFHLGQCRRLDEMFHLGQGRRLDEMFHLGQGRRLDEMFHLGQGRRLDEMFHLGQGRRLDEMNRSCSSAIEVASVCDTAWFNSVTHDGTNKCAKASSASFQF